MGLSNYIPSSATPRLGVCTSTTRPASPYEGQMIYETDTNRVLVYDNTAWVMIADTDTPPGLQLIKTQTIGTAVPSVSVVNAFSSEFDSYKIIVSDVTSSQQQNLYFQFESSGSPVSGALYGLSGFYQLTSTALNGVFGTAGTFWEVMPMNTSAKNHIGFDIYAPNLASWTRTKGFGGMNETVSFMYDGVHRSATSYTDFRMYVSGTMTGGNIRVYGYRNS